MAKIQIKSEKLTPFGGFFSIIPQTRRTAKEAIHRKGAVESHKGYWFYCRPSEDNQRFH